MSNNLPHYSPQSVWRGHSCPRTVDLRQASSASGLSIPRTRFHSPCKTAS